MFRMIRVRGRYAGLPGVFSYQGEVKPNEDPETAAKRLTDNYFMRRHGEMVDFEVIEVAGPERPKAIPLFGEFEHFLPNTVAVADEESPEIEEEDLIPFVEDEDDDDDSD